MNIAWKPVLGYEGMYEVSSGGGIRSLDRVVLGMRSGMMARISVAGRVMRPHASNNGYLTVRLSRDGLSTVFLLHRLVATAFLPNPDGLPQVAHLDGNPFNCEVVNLAWTDQSGNEAHKVEHGTHRRGDRHPMSKVSTTDVHLIRSGAMSAEDAVKVLGITRAHYGQIKNRRRWAHV